MPTDKVLSQCVFFSGCGDPEGTCIQLVSKNCVWPYAVEIYICVADSSCGRLHQQLFRLFIVYVRPDSTAYCTGFPEAPRVVTEQPGKEQVLPEKIQTILQSVRRASSASAEDGDEVAGGALARDPIVEQACYLPTAPDGIPVMGRIKDRCYISTGMTCWGILQGPAAGEAMAQLIVGDLANGSGPKINLASFTPDRFSIMSPIELVPNAGAATK